MVRGNGAFDYNTNLNNKMISRGMAINPKLRFRAAMDEAIKQRRRNDPYIFTIPSGTQPIYRQIRSSSQLPGLPKMAQFDNRFGRRHSQ